MRLPIDLGSPTPDPPREIRTFAAELAEDLEWSYRVAREVIGLGHRRAETRYNERVVAKQYKPGVLVRVLVHTHPHGVPSKLNAKYSGLCEVIEVRGPTLTLRELDTQRIFTASHDAVRASTLPPRAPQIPAPLANSQPHNSQAAEPLAEPQYPAQLDDLREEQLEAPDEIIDEFEPRAETENREFEAANANLEPRVIPSLLDLDIPIPRAFRDSQSHATPTSRPRRNARAPVRYESSQSFADTAHDPDSSNSRDSRVHTSTPLPNSPRLATPRRDSNAHLDAIRKKPRTAIRITSAASRDHARPAVLESASGLRVSWASRAVNCCAMTTRNATPPVSIRAPAAQREENESTRGERFAREERRESRDDRRDPCVFSFEPCAIAAFAHEVAERESRDTVARDCARQRVHASRESIGHALYADTATAHAAHDSHESRTHINRVLAPQFELFVSIKHREFGASITAAFLEFTRVSSASSPSFSSPPPISNPIAITSLDSIPRTPPISRSISIAAVSANSISPPMDPRDAAEIFSNAAFGFADFRVACEMLRDCAEVDIVIRGLDAQFRRDIASTGSNSIRDFLRAHFAKLPEILRALYEYAIVEERDAAPALSISNTGRREEVALCCLHIRFCCAALAIAELFRREFSTRPDHEKPQVLVVPHGLGWPIEIAPQSLSSTHALERVHTASAAQPPSTSTESAQIVGSFRRQLLCRSCTGSHHVQRYRRLSSEI